MPSYMKIDDLKAFFANAKVNVVLVFIPKFQYNAVILCEPIIWFFMTAYLVAVYLHEPIVFPKK